MGGNFNQNDGLVIYIKSSYNYISEIVKIHEFAAIKLTIKLENCNLLILGVYRSPSLDMSLFRECLESIVGEHLSDDKDHIILAGDLNVDILAESEDSSKYLNIAN